MQGQARKKKMGVSWAVQLHTQGKYGNAVERGRCYDALGKGSEAGCANHVGTAACSSCCKRKADHAFRLDPCAVVFQFVVLLALRGAAGGGAIGGSHLRGALRCIMSSRAAVAGAAVGISGGSQRCICALGVGLHRQLGGSLVNALGCGAVVLFATVKGLGRGVGPQHRCTGSRPLAELVRLC